MEKMENKETNQAAKFLRKNRNNRRWLMILSCLAVIVAGGTLIALTMPGQATTKKNEMLNCQYQAHTHTYECYNKEGNLICGKADYAVHVHMPDCYDTNGNLVCPLPEVKEHTHTEECYETQKVLVCEKTESEGHKHDESCYGKVQGELICQETAEDHVHTDACYAWTDGLICGQEEGAGAHTHTDDCYKDTQVLTCQIPEIIAHTHTAECYQLVKKSEAGTIAAENLTSTEAPAEEAKATEAVPTADETVAPEATEEAENAAATEEAAPTEELPEPGKVVEIDGVEYVYVLSCGMLEVPVHQHDENCFDTLEDMEAESNQDPDPTEAASEAPEATEVVYQCGKEEHVHTKDCIAPKTTETAGEETATPADGEATEPAATDAAEPAENETAETNNTEPADTGTATSAEETNVPDVVYICGKEEHVHDDSCLTAPETKPEQVYKDVEVQVDDNFSYDMDEYHLTFHVEGVASAEEVRTTKDLEAGDEEGKLPVMTAENIDFEVEQLSEDDKVYDAFAAAAAQTDEDAEESEETEAPAHTAHTQMLTALKLNFALDGAELDVSECKITAEVTPKQAAFTEVGVGETEETEDLNLMLTAMEYRTGEKESENTASDEVEKLNTATFSQQETTPMQITLSNSNLALIANSNDPMDIAYNVQYYAWLEEPVTQTGFNSGSLPDIELNGKKNEHYLDNFYVMDTTGGKLPQNGNRNNQAMRKLSLVKSTPDVYPDSGSYPEIAKRSSNEQKVTGSYQIKTERHLKEIFHWDETFNYRERPSFEYIKMLPGKYGEHYKLEEVWVLKPGKSATSLERDDWLVYTDPDNITMINYGACDTANGIIAVSKDTTIRLVYSQKPYSEEISATFYDYDISDGTYFKDKNGYTTLNTDAKGINSSKNCSSSTKYAFGNKNGSPFGQKSFSGQTGNMANSNGYFNCTFGLVQTDGKEVNVPPEFALTNGPAIFGSKEQDGKTVYSGKGNSLTFSRLGDTYILKSASVNGTKTADNLDQFWLLNSYSFGYVPCNNFWPMDQVKKEDRTDPLIGSNNPVRLYNGTEGITFNSDNGEDHNCFFGMNYAVSFEFDEHYTGPLEYLFFGDDDMWVYLDGKLVCDMGGVHSAAGEYVDLWNYLDRVKDAGTHTLEVYFVERGAAGSTCYTEFTLPSMEVLPTTAQWASLEISKKVEGETDENTEYSFALELTNLRAAVGYQVVDAEGNVSKSGSIVPNNKMGSVTFNLKAGEKLKIDNIPTGAKYTLRETLDSKFYPTIVVNDQEIVGKDGEVSGTLGSPTLVEIIYTNHINYSLPKTGSIGTWLYTLSALLLLAAASVLLYKKFGKGGHRPYRT